MSHKYRTAIVGSLQGLNVLLPAFRAVPEFEVVALCGRNETRTQDVASQAGVGQVFSDWTQLLDERDIDVVALALPPFVQGRAAVELAASGKHLFCEKPLATTLADAQTICAMAARHQRVGVVNFGFRLIEAFRDFHALVQSGLLGRPQFVMVEWLLAGRRNPGLTWNWKSDAGQGGGTLNLMGAHVLDYLRWLFGDIAQVRLQSGVLIPHRPDAVTSLPRPVTADDTCNLLLELAPALPATVSLSTVLAVPTSHRLRVWFEHGLLELVNGPEDDAQDGFKLLFHPAKSCAPERQAELGSRATHGRMAATFPGRIETSRRVVAELAEALAGRPHVAATLADALQVQAALETARGAKW